VPIAIFLTICANILCILFLTVATIVSTLQIVYYILFYNEVNDVVKPYILRQLELLCNKPDNDHYQYPFNELIEDYDYFCLTIIKNMYDRFWKIVDMYKQLKN
jgi:hypothetical protein